MKQKKVLCIGASVCLPRDGVRYEDTWYYLLIKKFKDVDFIDYFKRALLATEFPELYKNYYSYYYPDYVILDSGLTDCAPRYITKTKFKWKIILYIASVLHMTSFLWKQIKKFRKREADCVYTPINIYESQIDKLISNFLKLGVRKIIICKIAPISYRVIPKNPHWPDNIRKYNAVLEKLAAKYKNEVILIDSKSEIDESCYVEDGMHINAKGMNLAYMKLSEVLSNLLSESNKDS